MKIVAFYYTQTGQALEILHSVCRPLTEAGHEVVYKTIVPETPFPFPWTYDSFFQAFPESRQGIACAVKRMELDEVADAGLVIIAYQTWFLSPSLPVQGFFRDEAVRTFLRGKYVVTIDGCRNMWVMSHIKILENIEQCGGVLTGNIVLQDRHPNLVSVIPIVRWLIGGKKEKSSIFPAAGVSQKDIDGAAVFGKQIARTLADDDLPNLQEKLMHNGAIKYKPDIVFIEKIGHRLFGVWSKFILRKGGYGAPQRAFRLKLFKYYLFVVLYLISPVGLLAFYLTYPFRYRAIGKDRLKQCFM
ncbi:MAG: hypothetical protein LBS09_09925 [Bacteroidales bacterium]|jgi:hypothetical protein|nr:hypothetical protein [Bacteroidales bacterium]